ncbi:hypothetical protein K438DRAFT_715603 [Mycena galopus ATCC 62051]|nr:hypothetical protein K438DRAFT_715603 [Mycena galopus ATCC 62051]
MVAECSPYVPPSSHLFLHHILCLPPTLAVNAPPPPPCSFQYMFHAAGMPTRVVHEDAKEQCWLRTASLLPKVEGTPRRTSMTFVMQQGWRGFRAC